MIQELFVSKGISGFDSIGLTGVVSESEVAKNTHSQPEVTKAV